MAGLSKAECRTFLKNNERTLQEYLELLSKVQAHMKYKRVSTVIRTCLDAVGSTLAAVGTIALLATNGASLSLTIAGNGILLLSEIVHCIIDECTGLRGNEAEVGIPIIVPAIRWIVEKCTGPKSNKVVGFRESLIELAEKHDADVEGLPSEVALDFAKLLDTEDGRQTADEGEGSNLWKNVKTFLTHTWETVKKPFTRNQNVATALDQTMKGFLFGKKFCSLSTAIRDLVSYAATFTAKRILPPIVAISTVGMVAWDVCKVTRTWDEDQPIIDEITKAIHKLTEENEMLQNMLEAGDDDDCFNNDLEEYVEWID